MNKGFLDYFFATVRLHLRNPGMCSTTHHRIEHSTLDDRDSCIRQRHVFFSFAISIWVYSQHGRCLLIIIDFMFLLSVERGRQFYVGFIRLVYTSYVVTTCTNQIRVRRNMLFILG